MDERTGWCLADPAHQEAREQQRQRCRPKLIVVYLNNECKAHDGKLPTRVKEWLMQQEGKTMEFVARTLERQLMDGNTMVIYLNAVSTE